MIHHLRLKSGFLAGIWLVGLVTLVTLAAQTPTQIHPAPPPDVQRPITIAVLADGFTQVQEGDFKDAAANFFTYGLLLDPDFEPHKDLVTIKTIFKSVATPSESQFGFKLGTGVTNCSISWNESEDATGTTALINAVVGALNPTHVVVIGNHNYNFGCSHDIWSYVAVGAVGEPILEHEFGHLLAGLKDEYVIDALKNTPYPGPWDKKNCSTAKPPYWMNVGLPSTPANLTGCALYGVDIVHAFEDCKMGTKGAKFCHVCNREMQATWDFYGNPENFNPNLQARIRPVNLRVSAAGFFAAAASAAHAGAVGPAATTAAQRQPAERNHQSRQCDRRHGPSGPSSPGRG